MTNNVTTDIDVLARKAREAFALIEHLATRWQAMPEEMYTTRCNLAVLAESLEAMARKRDRQRKFGRVK